MLGREHGNGHVYGPPICPQELSENAIHWPVVAIESWQESVYIALYVGAAENQELASLIGGGWRWHSDTLSDCSEVGQILAGYWTHRVWERHPFGSATEILRTNGADRRPPMEFSVSVRQFAHSFRGAWQRRHSPVRRCRALQFDGTHLGRGVRATLYQVLGSYRAVSPRRS